MKKILIFFLVLSSFAAFAQTATKLSTYYSFNNVDLTVDDSGKGTKAQLSPTPPTSVCGIGGSAAEFKGNEYILLYDLSNKFTTSNFTLSFYFKPTNGVGIRDIFTNADSCTNKRLLRIQYDASARAIKVKMKDEKRGIDITAKTDNSTCWQHIVLVREGNYHRFYINGVKKSAQYSPDNQRINLFSISLFTIGRSECDPSIQGGHLKGIVDEVRFYEAALKEEEAIALYDKPDRIKNQDLLLFIGDKVSLNIENTCATKYSWSPTTYVSDPNIATPTIQPDKAGSYVYTVRFADPSSTCAATDTFKLTIIDPKQQPCGDVIMPNAFTPNGDDKNETFGLSNPYTIGTLKSFEIVDRWGGIMFSTTDPFQRWDGKFNDVAVQPGVYLYRISYNCQGNDNSKMGSFVLMQ